MFYWTQCNVFPDSNGGSSLLVQNRDVLEELSKKEKKLNRLKEKVVSLYPLFFGWLPAESYLHYLKFVIRFNFKVRCLLFS